MSFDSFPNRPLVDPKIYAYTVSDKNYKDLMKIGFTNFDVKKRVKQQFNIKDAGSALYEIVYETSAIKADGTSFSDKDIHRLLRNQGKRNPNNSEWFECSLAELQAAVLALKEDRENIESRTLNFGLRPEQREAIDKAKGYFVNSYEENPHKVPHFLWNAKMRFGKTFTTYQLAKEMGWKRILVMTFKPAVQSAWEEDLNSHIDFEGWKFLSSKNFNDLSSLTSKKPVVCFGSFQDFLGKNQAGGIKSKNEWVHTMNWDCVVFDEYHYGAWRENAKDLFEAEGKKEFLLSDGEGREYFEEGNMPITTNAYLYLSGTPFRAIAKGEFIEEQIFNWTYSDEQAAKKAWIGPANPYQALPRMVMLTYQLPNSVQKIARGGEFDEFDLNVFFSASGEKNNAKFKYQNEVQKWLDLIRGSNIDDAVSDLKLGYKKPPWPFSHVDFLNILSHTFWFLPSVSSCYAMKNLLEMRQNKFFHDYKILVVAGPEAGLGVEALPPVREAMGNPLKSKTIVLSCTKLTTGVSVPAWSAIFMLRNTSSPETYFQAAFRVQTPWTVKDPESVNGSLILKEECYIFDFAPNRALKQIADYSCRLNVDELNPEKKVEEFIQFLPVLAFDGSSMREVDAAGVLDIAMSGTTATLLARRWEDSSLVNVDNFTLQRLQANPDAMEALMGIEGFRNLNREIEVIINKSEAIKKAKKEANQRDLDDNEKNELKEEEREYKSLRKQIQDKLKKFATRIPVFMYLTDYREQTLIDVISELEPDLFQKVTGLTKNDFQLLLDLGLFNSDLMNDAVYKFKRYEDSSLSYTAPKNLGNKTIGLWDKTIKNN
jgi:superfamily II DNA or RNA helicase